MSLNRREFLSVTAAGLAARRLPAQEALPFGSTGVTVYVRPRDYSEDLIRYLTRLMDMRREERRSAVEAVTTRAQAENRIRQIRAKVWDMMGERPEKTPLNPRVVGTIERQGYKIHRLIYESRPKLFVTSNLYVPEGRGPFPAVLGSLGHASNGKAYTSYQTLFHTLASKGYVVLAYDPFGQGERIEYPGSAPGKSIYSEPGVEHDYAGKRLLLLGVNFALYRAWDGIRGIDYLLSRDDVDPNRIGCGGQSGGGTMTMYLAAMDERINAAVVSEGNTENVAQLNFEPPGAVDCAEQNLVPSLAYGLDRFDLLHAVAPRALMITISNKDAGTTYGPEYVADTLRGYEELKRTYRLLGAEDRVRLVETPMRHGYVYEHRRSSYAWYNLWLKNTGQDDSEPRVTVEPDEKLFCTPTGFVNSLGGESSFTLIKKLSERTWPAKPVTTKSIRDLLGIQGMSAPVVSTLYSITKKRDHSIEEVDIMSEAEIRVPAWVVHAPRGDAISSRPALLVVSDAQKDSFIGDDGAAAEMARSGYVVCVMDVRGRNQCTPRPPQRGPRYYFDRGEDFYIWDTFMLGRPMLGGYVSDVRAAFLYMQTRKDVDPARRWIIGQGTMGVAALLALALEPSASGGIVHGALSDYRSIVENDSYKTPFRIFAPGLLKHFDLPDVAGVVAPRPLLLLNPVNQENRSAEVERVKMLYPSAVVRSATGHPHSAWLDWLKETS